MWVKENGNNTTIMQMGKILVFTNVTTANRGMYVCFASEPSRKIKNTSLTTEENIEKVIVQTNKKHLKETTHTIAIETNYYSPLSSWSPTSFESSTEITADVNALTTTPLSILNSTLKTIDYQKQKPIIIIKTTTTPMLSQQEYYVFQKVNLTVRTPPGPVSKLYFKASTILGFLIWRFDKMNSGGYPIRSFTAEFRNISYKEYPFNSSYEHKWTRLDPINISPNVRQMEVYRLTTNTTYEFRIWANNQLGKGTVVTTNVTTLPETKEEDYYKGWDSLELIPNIILNPGFCEDDKYIPFSHSIVYDDDDDSDDYDSDESDHEPTIEKLKRKVSVFFTGPTIKRI